MNAFFDRIRLLARLFPDRPALALDDIRDAVTYGELWTLSGRIYAALKARGIGKEDMVLIHLRRGPEIVVAMLGTWRAGAACTVAEDSSPAKRVRAIREDSGVVLELDGEVYREMIRGEAAEDWEPVSPHDACYAVYTSGTTGNPKGILHEFGKIDLCVKSIRLDENEYLREGNRFAVHCDAGFVALFLFFMPPLYNGYTVYIPPRELTRNRERLLRFLEREAITEAFLAPALLRILDRLPECLKVVFTGSETVAGLYSETAVLHNYYAMSESAFAIATQPLDRAYDLPPVGKNPAGMEVCVCDEEGNRLAAGEKGEVCFRNPFTRGYIHLPEKTEQAFRDGFFRTGDLGYLDPEGTLYLCGRLDDMVKIHGNRVEPEEIEKVARKVLGTQRIAARCFVENDRAYTALYYLREDFPEGPADPDEIRQEMREYLPEYMIPSYFVPVDRFPVNTNGKLKRRELPTPEIRETAENYEPPRTEAEKQICAAMEKVLGHGKIGIRDDFFERGGDSLSAIRLAVKCASFSMVSRDIFRYRTAGKLAEYYAEQKRSDLSGKESDHQQVMRKAQELLAEANRKAWEKYRREGIIDSCYASLLTSPEYMLTEVRNNPGIILRTDGPVDPERLQKATDAAVRKHPYAAYDIRLRKKIPWVSYRDNPLPLTVKKAGELVSYGTEENNGHYTMVAWEGDRIHFGMSHVLTDGHGFYSFVSDVVKAYYGENEGGETPEAETEPEDYPADFAAVELPLPEGYVPYENPAKDFFEFPKGDRESKPFSGTILVPAEGIRAYAKQHAVTLQQAVCILMAEAIQKAFPENRKTLRFRCPMNTRGLFGMPGTFQNASMPHMFLNIEPEKMAPENHSALAEDLNGQFAAQYSYEYAASVTNRFSRFFRTGNQQDLLDAFGQYISETGLFASYIGKIAADGAAAHLRDVEQAEDAVFPFMVYATEFGDTMIFHVIQQTEDHRCIDCLKEILGKLK